MSAFPDAALDACLSDLAGRIDEDFERTHRQAWVDFLDGRCPTDVFTPPPRTPSPAAVDWPAVGVNDALDDPAAMLAQQFGMCSGQLASGDNRRLCVRCNYGTGILPSLFGCELFLMPAETNTLPTAVPLGSRDKVLALLDAGVPDVHSALAGRTLAMGERFLEALRRHPVLERNVTLYHPDTQGPIDIAEVVWGSDIFYAFHDDAAVLGDLLDLITETYIAFLRAWFALAGPSGDPATHWGWMHRGTIMIRDDSLMNLSPDAYVEFVRPRDQRLLDEFGGGAIHFCGRGDHFIEAMSEMAGLTAVNLSQPEYNDMSVIFAHTIDKDIPVIGLPSAGLADVDRPLRGKVHAHGEVDANRMAGR